MKSEHKNSCRKAVISVLSEHPEGLPSYKIAWLVANRYPVLELTALRSLRKLITKKKVEIIPKSRCECCGTSVKKYTLSRSAVTGLRQELQQAAHRSP